MCANTHCKVDPRKETVRAIGQASEFCWQCEQDARHRVELYRQMKRDRISGQQAQPGSA